MQSYMVSTGGGSQQLEDPETVSRKLAKEPAETPQSLELLESFRNKHKATLSATSSLVQNVDGTVLKVDLNEYRFCM